MALRRGIAGCQVFTGRSGIGLYQPDIHEGKWVMGVAYRIEVQRMVCHDAGDGWKENEDLVVQE